MILLAKVGIGVAATLAFTTAWVCHEGMIRVDVDEGRVGGEHVHFFVPATAVSIGLRVTPKHYLEHAAAHCRPYLPVMREISKELERYPNADLLDVRSKTDHVHLAVHDGKLYLDAVNATENVHVSFPAATLQDVADRLENAAPSI